MRDVMTSVHTTHMNTTQSIEIAMYQTAKGMNRFRGTCPDCGATFAGKFYPAQVMRAYDNHECKGA